MEMESEKNIKHRINREKEDRSFLLNDSIKDSFVTHKARPCLM